MSDKIRSLKKEAGDDRDYRPGNSLGGVAATLGPAAPSDKSLATRSVVDPRVRTGGGKVDHAVARGEGMQIITKPHGGRQSTYLRMGKDGDLEVAHPKNEPKKDKST